MKNIRWLAIFNTIYFWFVFGICIIYFITERTQPSNMILMCLIVIGVFWLRDEILELKKQQMTLRQILRAMEGWNGSAELRNKVEEID